MSNTLSSKASILSSSEIFFTLILSHFFLSNDKLNKKKIAGLLFGIIGIVLINVMNGEKLSWFFSLTGEGFLVMTSLLTAISSIIIKKEGSQFNLIRITGWQFLLGGILLTFFGYGKTQHMLSFTWGAAGLLFYLSLLSAVAFTIWFLLLQFNCASEITVYKLALPIFGAILSMLFLQNEQFTWAIGAGLAFVVLGILIANSSGRTSNQLPT
jgi:drug/metabolite transporter (DMT)-like permease